MDKKWISGACDAYACPSEHVSSQIKRAIWRFRISFQFLFFHHDTVLIVHSMFCDYLWRFVSLISIMTAFAFHLIFPMFQFHPKLQANWWERFEPMRHLKRNLLFVRILWCLLCLMCLMWLVEEKKNPFVNRKKKNPFVLDIKFRKFRGPVKWTFLHHDSSISCHFWWKDDVLSCSFTYTR